MAGIDPERAISEALRAVAKAKTIAAETIDEIVDRWDRKVSFSPPELWPERVAELKAELKAALGRKC